MKPTKEEYIKIFSEMKKCRFLNELKTDRYDSTIDCFCIVRIVDKNTNCLVLYDNISKMSCLNILKMNSLTFVAILKNMRTLIS